MSQLTGQEGFYHVGGVVGSEAPSYIERRADKELLSHVAAGDFCYVLTPRQMGKTSLAARTVAKLKKRRIRGVRVDLAAMIERDSTNEQLYAGLLDAFIRQLRLPIELSQWWQEHALVGATRRFVNFVSDEVLPHIRKRLVVFMDEIDSTLNLSFSDDFFATIRAFYNDRARDPAFNRLTFVFLGVASPSDLIKDRTRTPFNIGHRIELTDFTLQEARKLAEGLPLDRKTGEQFLERVLYWTGGHPYLTQKVCECLTKAEGLEGDPRRVDGLIDSLYFSDTTWNDSNLAHVRDRVVEAKDHPDALLELYRRVRIGEDVLDDERSVLHSNLKLSGIVKVIPCGLLKPRNRIYERVFDAEWVDTVQRERARKQPPPKLNVGLWKKEVAGRLKDWRSRMERTGVESVYAFLAAAALDPVIQAAHAGDWAAIMTLGSLVAGVGDNWLATHIQNWRDEGEAARSIAAHAAAEPGLRAELDAVLDTLRVVPQAKAALAEGDRSWFGRTLRAELATKGNLDRFAAYLTGSGAIAQGNGAAAAGAGGVAISGVVHGDVYLGTPTRDPAEALTIYRQVLADGCRQVSLRGLDKSASDATCRQRFELANVYVDLDTTTQVPLTDAEKRKREREALFPSEQENRLLKASEAVAGQRRVVLLGDPGSGKSTYLNHLTFCLASYGLDHREEWLARLAGWPKQEGAVVPVTVVLRDFIRWAPEKTKKAKPSHLWSFIKARLEEQNMDFVAEPLHDRLERGQVIILLDGLDEIPGSRQRTFTRDAIDVFAARYPRNRFVVTCRTLSYQDPAWQLSDFRSFTLAPFSEAQIDSFIAAWYGELARLGSIKAGTVEGVTQSLKEAARRPDLWPLASNPLLLTVMALVHTHKGRLPEARALLYEETVEVLLWRWEQVKVSDDGTARGLRELLVEAGRTEVELQRALSRLAFDVHKEGGTAGAAAAADIGENMLFRVLVGLHPDRSFDWAQELIKIMKLRAGLLLERTPGVYTFPHRTFQEYLAGAYLAAQPDFAAQATSLVAEGAFWREVILLAVGRLIYKEGTTDKPLALLGELCPETLIDEELAWRRAWLAGEVLDEMGVNRAKDSSLGRDLLKRVRGRLAALASGGHLSPVERAKAADTLAHLGDPRSGVGLNADGLPDIVWCDIEPGSFTMGSEKYDDEKPRFECNLIKEPYRIAKYAVTNRQFAAFVEDGGYTDRWQHCWTDAGWKWKGNRSRPDKGGGAFDVSNHPVVGVRWFEAVAFCNWLSERLGYEVALPSEAQWERAARHIDGRRYPWGSAEDTAIRCNMAETRIGTTSAVGIFPAGDAECGAADMAGNVLEWCGTKWLSNYGDYEKNADDTPDGGDPRVLRGGAFFNDESDVRCASRDRFNPNYRYDDFGFRVVASPSTSGL